MRQLLITLSLVLVVILPVSARAQKTSAATYEVYALSYGVYPNFPVSALIAGADKDRKIDLQMMIWLLKGPNGRNILVDSGCYHESVLKGKPFKDFIKPSDTLAKLGLKPEDITDLIISHMHWDHADGMDLLIENPGHVMLAHHRLERMTRQLHRQRRAHSAVSVARRFVRRHGTPRARHEFQMLYGIRRDVQTQLVRAGEPVRVYVPYGTEWYPYLTRRLAERPANMWFFTSQLVRAGG